jgi:ABC-type sugar transport system ATPase subunit
MVGRDIPPSKVTTVPPTARELLRVEHLSVERRSEEAGATLRDVSLSVRAGEVVGLAGLVGAGRTDLLLSLVGAHGGEVRGGVWLDGHE